MPKRPRVKLEATPNSYFVSEKTNYQFVPSGCTLLDCALGGGWALGRVANIVGDKSTAKTALATEALINFVCHYPDGRAAYRDAEAAFDLPYAEAMGLPLGKISFGDDSNPILTVEDFIRDFDTYLDARVKDKSPGIYVLDSMDALSDEAEMDREIGKGSFGTDKSRLLSKMFRTKAHKIEQANTGLLIVSQVRENIGFMVGEKYKRSGGKAMDHYNSQIVWLAHIGKIQKTINKVKRTVGIEVKASIKKNKVGVSFRDVEFDFIFGYGIEDLGACVKWLAEVGRSTDANVKAGDVKNYLKELDNMSNEEYRKEHEMVSEVVKNVWREVETTFLPRRTKYGAG